MYTSVVFFFCHLPGIQLFFFVWLQRGGWFVVFFFFFLCCVQLWCVGFGFCIFKKEFLLSSVLLQAKCRLALGMSDIYHQSMSEPVHEKVCNLKLTVGGSLLAGK